MNLSQALKQKNRLAGEYVRLAAIFSRENSRRDDNPSKIDAQTIYNQMVEVSNNLGELKAKIAAANVPIYPAIERMSELKTRIAYLTQLNKREGAEVVQQYNSTAINYTHTSFINQEKADQLILEIQKEIESLQDAVDSYNATTELV